MMNALRVQEVFDVPPERAQAIVEMFEEVLSVHAATRQDLELLRASTRQDFELLRKDFDVFRKDIDCKFDVQRAETKAEFASLRKEMAEGFMKFNLASGFFVALALLLLKLFGLNN